MAEGMAPGRFAEDARISSRSIGKLSLDAGSLSGCWPYPTAREPMDSRSPADSVPTRWLHGCPRCDLARVRRSCSTHCGFCRCRFVKLDVSWYRGAPRVVLGVVPFITHSRYGTFGNRPTCIRSSWSSSEMGTWLWTSTAVFFVRPLTPIFLPLVTETFIGTPTQSGRSCIAADRRADRRRPRRGGFGVCLRSIRTLMGGQMHASDSFDFFNPGLNHCEATQVEGRAGDVILWSTKLPHGTRDQRIGAATSRDVCHDAAMCGSRV